MGKSKKSFSGRSGKNIALTEQILQDKSLKPSQRIKTRIKKDEDDSYVDDRLSRKILEQARIQQEELAEEFGVEAPSSKKEATTKITTLRGPSASHDSDVDDNDDELQEHGDDYECIEVDEEDEKAMDMFMNKEPVTKRTLADIIMEKIMEKQTEIASHMSDDVGLEKMDERVVRMFRDVGKVFSTYRSGKIPKFFKIIPSMSNWEQALYLTEPDKWSAAAVFQATRLFISNLKAKQAQRFLNLILLPRIRDDIAEYKRVNFHLYEALCKSLFKPAAFFKGILLPLCEGRDCTLREAIIIGSVVKKYSIPVLHSSAAIMKICEMDYSGASSIFLRILYEKKYALPYKVIDESVNHFLRFLGDRRVLPVLWHQNFLAFVQHYKEDISSEQKDALFDVLRAHTHEQITPEIRRELIHSKCRDVEENMAIEPGITS